METFLYGSGMGKAIIHGEETADGGNWDVDGLVGELEPALHAARWLQSHEIDIASIRRIYV